MPLVRITLRQGKSPEFLRDAGDAILAALVAKGNAPADSRFIVIDEVPASNMVVHPSYGGVERSEGVVLIEITLNAGRSLEVKKAMYEEIVRRLGEAVDVRPDDVIISLTEVSKENWSFGKGLATYV